MAGDNTNTVFSILFYFFQLMNLTTTNRILLRNEFLRWPSLQKYDAFLTKVDFRTYWLLNIIILFIIDRLEVREKSTFCMLLPYLSISRQCMTKSHEKIHIKIIKVKPCLWFFLNWVPVIGKAMHNCTKPLVM